MIVLPRRSITRFFVPLIDVLVLFFCVFLFMPMVTQGDNPNGPSASFSNSSQPKSEPLLEEIARLRNKNTLDIQGQLFINVLEIDSKTGELFKRLAERKKIANRELAAKMIEEDLLSSNGKKIMYVILYPQEDTGFPTREQRENYQRWFSSTLVTFQSAGKNSTQGGLR
jgi:biopolymer transport protein ExbD